MVNYLRPRFKPPFSEGDAFSGNMHHGHHHLNEAIQQKKKDFDTVALMSLLICSTDLINTFGGGPH